MNEYIVEMKDIEKSFGDNLVLKGVDFAVRRGEIHALLGENGTGKSTLMNILGGILKRDAGEIYYDGELISDNKRGDEVLKEKISFIHQELALIPDLKVYENLFFAQEIKKGLFLDTKKMQEESINILNQLDVHIDPNLLVKDLNASYQQVIEISKGLMKNSKIIIMDEPTSSLTDSEIEQLFEVLTKLKNKGISIIFISHKLNEVIDICDRYTVLRDGEVVKTGNITNETREEEIARYMVGAEFEIIDLYRKRELGDIILETQKLTRNREFYDVNINLKKGEILGITGLLGDGRSELMETVFGSRGSYEGKILLKGQEIKCDSTKKSIKRGISYVPRNRKENSIIKDLSISDNLNISNFRFMSNKGILNQDKIKDNNIKFKEKLNIKLEKFDDLITKLSGGNQQKVIISRSLSVYPDIVILDNPTQGVDIGSKFEIYEHVIELSEEGISFFILSNEAAEIMAICDRAYVMFHGEVKKELERSDFSEERIMTYATGGTSE